MPGNVNGKVYQLLDLNYFGRHSMRHTLRGRAQYNHKLSDFEGYLNQVLKKNVVQQSGKIMN
jgi:hypothetical protein